MGHKHNFVYAHMQYGKRAGTTCLVSVYVCSCNKRRYKSLGYSVVAGMLQDELTRAQSTIDTMRAELYAERARARQDMEDMLARYENTLMGRR